MKTLCLDIGNTTAHMAVVSFGKVLEETRIPTGAFREDFPQQLKEYLSIQQIAYCSVVPSLNDIVEQECKAQNLSLFNLNSQTCPIPIDYPNPPEIGQDRLANAVGACAISELPTVVIDMGTATTFDIITMNEGYIGGVIAPGLSLMREYLHEKTALLPEIRYRTAPWPESCIGKSTQQAMEIGGIIGYTGMIKEILQRLEKDIEALAGEEVSLSLLLTGGKASFLEKALGERCNYHPYLTLQGLEIACSSYSR
jgi:type III pantothenate kinase